MLQLCHRGHLILFKVGKHSKTYFSIKEYLSYCIFKVKTFIWINTSGVNGKPAYCILFNLGRNDEIHKEYLSASSGKCHYFRLSSG